ncbi:hypothetical protein AGOR_G00222820 [Albula goreensis]|uniref:Uncharacterized protein n=1 Tax=Albula goreensis TaxID=1534307 RepID=A0A8T3CKQ8_9TELE|nr:hypothetical protein AGOR_G00222820 [Albula goreensis]
MVNPPGCGHELHMTGWLVAVRRSGECRSPVRAQTNPGPSLKWNSRISAGCRAFHAAVARGRAASPIVSPTMKVVVDAVWVVWGIGASIYDYVHTNAMEERIHALENAITLHQSIIGLLTACLAILFTYIVLRRR